MDFSVLLRFSELFLLRFSELFLSSCYGMESMIF